MLAIYILFLTIDLPDNYAFQIKDKLLITYLHQVLAEVSFISIRAAIGLTFLASLILKNDFNKLNMVDL